MTVVTKVPGSLKTSDEFKRVVSKGRRAGSKHLTVTYLANGTGRNRVGIGIPERTARSAVRRNRFKRVIREWFRVSSGLIEPGYDFVITVFSDPGFNEGECIRSDLSRLLGENGLLLNGD